MTLADERIPDGAYVEKHTGEARWLGHIASSYLTRKGKLRYVVEVEPQGFQMIAVPSQLRVVERPQALPEDVRGLVEKVKMAPGWHPDQDTCFSTEDAESIATMLTAQQATIQEMAGEVERLRVDHQSYCKSWDMRRGIDRKEAELAELREELACTLEELIDHNGDDMDDSRTNRVASLRTAITKHQPKDPADGR